LFLRRTLLVLTFPALLTACATDPAPVPVAETDVVSSRLDDVIRSAPARDIHADVRRPQASFTWESVDVDYFGDVSVFLRMMSEGLGWRFAVTGPGPYIPIFVTVSAKGSPAEEVLRKLALQLGGRADIVLRDTMIELRYRPHR